MKKNKIVSSPFSKSHSITIEEILRVNQAGELGAVNIYKGQIDCANNNKCYSSSDISKLIYMSQQEKEHLEYFNGKIMTHKVRPSALFNFWKVSGYCLGYISAKFGKRYAMACTEAIEDVIADHYQEQIECLEVQGNICDDLEKDNLLKNIKRIREEEIEHGNTGAKFSNEPNPPLGYSGFKNFIKNGCRLAIAVAKKI